MVNRYWVVLLRGRPSPSVAQIQAGTDGTDAAALQFATTAVPTAAATVSVSVSTGLAASTSYDVWMAAQDSHTPTPNIHTSGTLLEVTTSADTTPPVTLSGYPAVANVGDFHVTLQVQLDESGSFNYVVLRPGAVSC